MFAVTEVRHQVVESHDRRAAENSVVARDLQLGEHVPHNPGDGAEVGHSDDAAVHGAGLLLGEPLGDAGVAEGVLTMRSLHGEGTAGCSDLPRPPALFSARKSPGQMGKAGTFHQACKYRPSRLSTMPGR